MALKSNLKINVNKLFQAVLIGFVAVQIVSWVISSFVSDIPLLKGGPLLFLFLIIILFSTLYTLGQNINQLNIKRDGLFVLLVFGAVIALFIFLPNIIPQIFSTNVMEFGENIKRLVTTIMRFSPGGIVPN